MDWPPRDEAVRAALLAAWEDGSWGRYDGGHVARLEAALAALTGCPHVLTCASGTLAVEMALRAVPVAPGDEVVLAAYDYGGNFLSVHALGATPVLVDVLPGNVAMSPDRLRDAIGPRTRAVIVSHLHGGLADMPAILEACGGRCVVVEDAAQCPGATVAGRPAGSWGEVGILSFGGSKLLSAGRGGALVTRRADLAQRARLALGRGNNRVAPLSELQALVLLPQLEALPARHEQRLRAMAQLTDLPGLVPFRNEVDGSPGYYKVGLRYRGPVPRARFVATARAAGVPIDEGFRGLHVGRAASRYRAAGPLDEAQRAHDDMVILHHPFLLDAAEVGRVAEALRRLGAGPTV